MISSPISGYKLAIELVPSGSWNSNLRSILTAKGWNTVRQPILRRAGGSCEICKAKSGRLECHEVWNYDDDTGVQSLVDVVAICKRCHQVKHFGFTMTLVDKGVVKMDQVIDHFRRVNGCSGYDFEDHVSESFKVWNKRNLVEWEMDISKVTEILEEEEKYAEINKSKSKKIL